jgi:hypothetical protein
MQEKAIHLEEYQFFKKEKLLRKYQEQQNYQEMLKEINPANA